MQFLFEGFLFVLNLVPRLFERAHECGRSYPGLDARGDLVRAGRFAQKIVCAAGQPLCNLLRFIVAGHQKNLAGTEFGIVPHPFPEGGAVHPRHHPVENRQIGPLAPKEITPPPGRRPLRGPNSPAA
ncbi:MAG: hypothetical protein EWM72_00162 [Nitrospira sp.]|nr:MAG: hypothetical protein EWM72_00162 [Nitrospira sp.]